MVTTISNEMSERSLANARHHSGELKKAFRRGRERGRNILLGGLGGGLVTGIAFLIESSSHADTLLRGLTLEYGVMGTILGVVVAGAIAGGKTLSEVVFHGGHTFDQAKEAVAHRVMAPVNDRQQK